MNILFIHNRYKCIGGEDVVVRKEMDMLQSKGHKVEILSFTNDDIASPLKKLQTFFSCIYSWKSKNIVKSQLKERKFDLIHVHNFFPIVSPSIYDAAKECGIPVLQTLHNYRLICPAALLLRNGEICEKCIKGNFLNAVLYRCYRKSILGSTSVALMDWVHRFLDTWNKKIDRIICLTDFARNKYSEGGFDRTKIVVKPNFVTSGKRLSNTDRENIGLFVGRISEEKGINSLIEIHGGLKGKLIIAGDGPEMDKLKGLEKFEVLGFKSSEDVQTLMQKVSFLVFPSIWYEGLPMTILEAFSNKLPVIASNIGAMSSIIENHKNGLLFELGDLKGFRDKVNWAFVNYELVRQYGSSAYEDYKEKYSVEVNYKQQIEIYQEVINEFKKK